MHPFINRAERKLICDWWIEHRDDKEEEADDLMTRAERLQQKHPRWTLQQCADRLEQIKPNGEMVEAEDTEDEPAFTRPAAGGTETE